MTITVAEQIQAAKEAVPWLGSIGEAVEFQQWWLSIEKSVREGDLDSEEKATLGAVLTLCSELKVRRLKFTGHAQVYDLSKLSKSHHSEAVKRLWEKRILRVERCRDGDGGRYEAEILPPLLPFWTHPNGEPVGKALTEEARLVMLAELRLLNQGRQAHLAMPISYSLKPRPESSPPGELFDAQVEFANGGQFPAIRSLTAIPFGSGCWPG